MTTMVRTPLALARAASEALMAAYTPEELPPAGRWHYHQGIFLYGMLKVWEETGEESFYGYAKAYVDLLVDRLGNLYFARDELDSIMPGLLLFTFDQEEPEDRRYRAAAAKLRGLFGTLNRTAEGGFWHKDKYPYQMWLDGLYMGGVFAMKYEKAYGEAGLIDMVLEQERLMRKYMFDKRTGLLFHAWDESRKFPWANPETGCSPEFWGRSLGWYGMAVADFLDELGAEHPAYSELCTVLGSFAESLIRYQDAGSGLWYQVVDKGDREDNWLETSCTSLFVYTIAKAYRHGCVGSEAYEAAVKGFEGLANRVYVEEATGRLVVPDICIGTSAGDYTNYVTRPVHENDLHGVGAFILACMEMNRLSDLRMGGDR
ncbi:glycoside hydrolase family 105 protein [Cohnella sp.]|uniref:glycoside hydrolase family 88/105 protein n=1 Tax=Cohnella sp. TaxID=1883426 RepID=UPI003568109D